MIDTLNKLDALRAQQAKLRTELDEVNNSIYGIMRDAIFPSDNNITLSPPSHPGEDQNGLDLDDYAGAYIMDSNGGYIDGPFGDVNEAAHQWDIDPHQHAAHHIEELSDAEYKDKWFE